MTKQQISKSQDHSIKYQAVSQRTRRTLETIKNQFLAGDPLHMYEDVKKIIDDTLKPLIVQRDSVAPITFAQIFQELLMPLGNYGEQDVKRIRDEKSEQIPLMPIVLAFDMKKASQTETNELSVSVLPSPSANQGKVP